MKQVLLISSSSRPRGNGETLLALCRNFLSELPSQFYLKSLSLKDFNIQNCTGCMSCAINKEFCKINDDLRNLIDQILNCDVLVLSSPVYFLGAASIIKTINDRLLFMHNLVNYSDRKPAGIIITAGRKGWEGYSVQNLSILLLSLGFKINDVLLAHGQGPSEVLLDHNIQSRVKNFTEKVIYTNSNPDIISDKCPICYNNSFNILDQTRIECPLCNISGKIIDYKDNKALILFSESDINNSRWSYENLKDHMENWVQQSGETYRNKVREIIQLRKKLLD